MKILPNKKERNIDFRYLADVKTYRGLSKQEIDVAINGVPFEGSRYPLCYVFFCKSRYRNVLVTLTNEHGVLIGESIITRQSANFKDSCRGVVKIGDRITDLDYSVLRFV